jgi:integrase
MNNLGIECYIPRLPRENEHRYVPHIYSEKEILDIFDACDSLRPRTFRGRTCYYARPALFRLLYSTGIRIGEALAIKNQDVDFKKKHIFINKTKNCHQRFAPINNTLASVLKDYIRFRNHITCKPVGNPSSPLFVNSKGEPLSQVGVQHIFNHIILTKAGIPFIGQHMGPRIHDIRHTACVHALKKLVSGGYDIYCCMPLLANFMGHINPMSTETYLRLSQEVYPEVIGVQALQAEEIAHILSRSVTTKF